MNEGGSKSLLDYILLRRHPFFRPLGLRLHFIIHLFVIPLPTQIPIPIKILKSDRSQLELQGSRKGGGCGWVLFHSGCVYPRLIAIRIHLPQQQSSGGREMTSRGDKMEKSIRTRSFHEWIPNSNCYLINDNHVISSGGIRIHTELHSCRHSYCLSTDWMDGEGGRGKIDMISVSDTKRIEQKQNVIWFFRTSQSTPPP